MIHNLSTRLMDLSVHPDFAGLPDNLTHGLVRVTDNAGALLLAVATLGIVLSLGGMVVGSWMQNQQLSERSRHGLVIAASAGALLFIAVGLANYAMRTFQ